MRNKLCLSATPNLQLQRMDLSDMLFCLCCGHRSCAEVRGGAMAAADGARRLGDPAGEAIGGGVLRGTAQRSRSLQSAQPRQSRRRPKGA